MRVHPTYSSAVQSLSFNKLPNFEVVSYLDLNQTVEAPKQGRSIRE